MSIGPVVRVELVEPANPASTADWSDFSEKDGRRTIGIRLCFR